MPLSANVTTANAIATPIAEPYAAISASAMRKPSRNRILSVVSQFSRIMILLPSKFEGDLVFSACSHGTEVVVCLACYTPLRIVIL